MADIFISYKREEKVKAKMLANALARKGYSVWWDPQLRAGETVDDEIEKELETARCVIVLWSKRSVKSDYVKAEARYALTLKKMLPVMIDNVKLPFRFADIHTGDLVGWDGSEHFPGFEKLLSDLEERLEQARSLEPATVEEPFGDSQREPVFPFLALPTPELEPVSVEDSLFPEIYTLKWTKVAIASGYVLEKSWYEDFSDARIVYEGQENSFGTFGGIMDIGKIGFYRVKAKGGVVYPDSEWSNSVLVGGDTLKKWHSGSR